MNVPNRLSKNTQISNFMKIRPVAAELFNEGGQTDRQTDMTKLMVAFRNYTNAPKNEMVCVSNINMKKRKDPASIKAKNNKFQTPCLQAGGRQKSISP